MAQLAGRDPTLPFKRGIKIQALKDFILSMTDEKKIAAIQSIFVATLKGIGVIANIEDMPTSMMDVAIDWSAGGADDNIFKLTIGDYTIIQNADDALSQIVDTLEISNSEAAYLAAQGIVVGLGSNSNLQNITSNLTLPTTGDYSTTISWSSSNPSVISNTGVVTQPSGSDATVIMTATISKDGATQTKSYTVIVKAASGGGLFSSTWDTTKTSTQTSGTNSIKLPLDASGVYNFTVNWGDGSSNIITSYNQAEATHTYSTGGEYTITIDGQCNGFGFYITRRTDAGKLLSINDWGSVKLHNNGYQFADTKNMINIGQPDLSNINNAQGMFMLATLFNQDISSWNVSNITNMSYMFSHAAAFNQPIGSWDVSNVTTIQAMFNNATVFNQLLNSWGVSSVTNMQDVFNGASAFNQPLNNWNVSNVTNMSNMFTFAQAFNQPLNGWDVSSVTNMGSMFYNTTAFNQNIGSWDISSVTNMSSMFAGVILSTTNYDAILNGWATLDVGETQIPTNVSFGGGNSIYSSAGADARNTLINTYGWTILDGD